MNLTYFLTGASGFVGLALSHCLRSSGARVLTLIRQDDQELRRIGVEVHIGDISDIPRVITLMDGVDIVVHCAADARFGNGNNYETVNVKLTRRLIEAVKTSGTALKRFVFISTIGAVDRAASDNCLIPITESSRPFPTSDYGRSKLKAEQVVFASGLPFVIIRACMVVGRHMRTDSHFAVFTRWAISNAILSRFAWPGQFSIVHVDDLARGIETAATHSAADGKVFNCAGGGISLAECFELCQPGTARFGLAWARPFSSMFSFVLPFKLKALLLPALIASDESLRALGWKPERQPAEALRDVIERERARLDPDVAPVGQTVVTGAASGLGRALVDTLAPRRQKILLIDQDRRGLDDLKRIYPHCSVVTADLAKSESIAALLSGDEWNRYPISELFACAGIGCRGAIQDIPNEVHQRIFSVNLLARLALGQVAISQMTRAHFGRVVMISSSSAFQPLPYMATYAASNTALLSLSEAWAVEVASSGVHIMTVCPGGMKTNFQKSAGVREIEMEKLMTTDEMAVAIFDGLKMMRQTLIVPFRSLAMSFMARILPRKISVILWGRLMEKMR